MFCVYFLNRWKNMKSLTLWIFSLGLLESLPVIPIYSYNTLPLLPPEVAFTSPNFGPLMWACHLNSFCHSWKEMGTCKIWGTRPASAACSTGGWMVPESANVSSPITKQTWQLATLALPCQLSEVLLHPLVAVFNYLVFANISTGIHTPRSSFPLSHVFVLFSMVDQA